MKKILILFFVLFASAGYGQVEQDSTGVWVFYGYVGNEKSPAVPNDGKFLNDMIKENVGKEVKLSVFLDKNQAESFAEEMSFTVYDDIDNKLPAVRYTIMPEKGTSYVYDTEVDSIEGRFIVESATLMRSLVVSVVLRQKVR